MTKHERADGFRAPSHVARVPMSRGFDACIAFHLRKKALAKMNDAKEKMRPSVLVL
jgi:hypothetical protein